jgi:hypothetical protein
MGAALAALILCSPVALAQDDDFGGLPEAEGREEVYYGCIACHSIRTVTNQRLSRRVWDEVLTWMVEEQAMPELEPDERQIILDYLSTQLGTDS